MYAYRTWIRPNPTLVYTRGHETKYKLEHCSIYSQTFYPSAIRLRNSLPTDLCQLPPQSFKEKLSTLPLSAWINCKQCFVPMHGTFYHHLLDLEHLLCTTSSTRDHYYASRYYSEVSPVSTLQWKKKKCNVLIRTTTAIFLRIQFSC